MGVKKNKRSFFFFLTSPDNRMPKLSLDVMEQKMVHIEEAAKNLFITQGFHATSMRDIAAAAEVSLGNLYTYYKTKDELWESIVAKYQEIIDRRLATMFEDIDEPLEPENLVKFGYRVKDMVNDHSDYWLLMYIDVLEFQNRHFRKLFENLVQNLNHRFGPYFAELRRTKSVADGIDPETGYAAAYMQLFNYFLVEKLFGGNLHLGHSDDHVVTMLADIFSRGILQPERIRKPQTKASTRGRGSATS